MADTVRPYSYYDLSDIFPQAINNDSLTAASAAGSVERPSAYEPVVIACSTGERSRPPQPKRVTHTLQCPRIHGAPTRLLTSVGLRTASNGGKMRCYKHGGGALCTAARTSRRMVYPESLTDGMHCIDFTHTVYGKTHHANKRKKPNLNPKRKRTRQ